MRDDHPPLNRSAGDAAVDVIRQAILAGTLQPGQRLTEHGLARDLRISRTPVREALRVLQTEGLVSWAPYRGSTVRTYDVDDLDDMYQLRALLEGHAARRAALRIAREEVDRLRESCVRFEALGDATEENVQQIVEENLLFHTIILAAAGSQRLLEMVRKVIELPLVYKSYVWYSPNQKRISEHTHQQLTHALAARDADRAELIMREHVYEARDLLVTRMRSGSKTRSAPMRSQGRPLGRAPAAPAALVGGAGRRLLWPGPRRDRARRHEERPPTQEP